MCVCGVYCNRPEAVNLLRYSDTTCIPTVNGCIWMYSIVSTYQLHTYDTLQHPFCDILVTTHTVLTCKNTVAIRSLFRTC